MAIPLLSVSTRNAGISASLSSASPMPMNTRLRVNHHANSLYYREAAGSVVVVSEPLDTDRAHWKMVPQRHLIVARKHGPVELLPFPEEARVAAE